VVQVRARPAKGHLQGAVQLVEGGVGRARDGPLDGRVGDLAWVQLDSEDVVWAWAGRFGAAAAGGAVLAAALGGAEVFCEAAGAGLEVG